MRKRASKCIECGGSLHVHRELRDGQSVIAGRGHKGNGLFCTVTCGFKWAVRWARRFYFWR